MLQSRCRPPPVKQASCFGSEHCLGSDCRRWVSSHDTEELRQCVQTRVITYSSRYGPWYCLGIQPSGRSHSIALQTCEHRPLLTVHLLIGLKRRLSVLVAAQCTLSLANAARVEPERAPFALHQVWVARLLAHAVKCFQRPVVYSEPCV